MRKITFNLNGILLEDLFQILALMGSDFMILIKENGEMEGYVAISNQKFSAFYRGLRDEQAMDEILRKQKSLDLEIMNGVSAYLQCRVPLMGYLIERAADSMPY